MQPMLSRTQDGLVKFIKVKLIFDRLNVFPSNTSQNCVDVCIYQFLPHVIHERSRGHGRILQLSAQDKKWLAINHQLLGVVGFAKMWDLFRVHCGWSLVAQALNAILYKRTFRQRKKINGSMVNIHDSLGASYSRNLYRLLPLSDIVIAMQNVARYRMASHPSGVQEYSNVHENGVRIVSLVHIPLTRSTCYPRM